MDDPSFQQDGSYTISYMPIPPEIQGVGRLVAAPNKIVDHCIQTTGSIASSNVILFILPGRRRPSPPASWCPSRARPARCPATAPRCAPAPACAGRALLGRCIEQLTCFQNRTLVAVLQRGTLLRAGPDCAPVRPCGAASQRLDDSATLLFVLSDTGHGTVPLNSALAPVPTLTEVERRLLMASYPSVMTGMQCHSQTASRESPGDGRHLALVGVQADLGGGEADIAARLPDDRLVVYLCAGGDLAEDHHHAGLGGRLASHLRWGNRVSFSIIHAALCPPDRASPLAADQHVPKDLRPAPLEE